MCSARKVATHAVMRLAIRRVLGPQLALWTVCALAACGGQVTTLGTSSSDTDGTGGAEDGSEDATGGLRSSTGGRADVDDGIYLPDGDITPNGAPPEDGVCGQRTVDTCVSSFERTSQLKCYDLEELSDPCSGTHFALLEGSEGMGGARSIEDFVQNGELVACPTFDELYFGQVDRRCCWDAPECEWIGQPAVLNEGSCCYRVQTSCHRC